MKTKFFTLFLALAASVGTLCAKSVQIGDLYYTLNPFTKTASVTGIANGFTGELIIPSTFDIEQEVVPIVAAPAAGYVTFVIQIPENSECNGIAFKGSLDGVHWTAANQYLGENGIADVNSCIKFEKIDGTTNWFKATYKLGTNQYLAGKICLIYQDDASWDGQAREWEFLKDYCTADCSSNWDDIQVDGTGLVYIKVAKWSRSECAPSHTYTITVTVPAFCGDEFPMEVIGSFCGWSENGAVALTKVSGNTYRATITGKENDLWKVRGVGDWGKEIQVYFPEENLWLGVQDNELYTDLNVTVDYSNANKYRWSVCDEYAASPRKESTANNSQDTEIVTFTVTSIGYAAFNGCTGLTSLTIPNSITSIEAYAFAGCDGLTAVNVATNNPNYYSEDGVLFNETKTTLVLYPGGKQGAYTIPNGVTSIGNSAFYNCSGLTSVTIPNSLINIIGGIFINCTGLTAINVETNNPNYYSEDGVLFDKTKTTIVLYPSGKQGAYTIPNSVISIGEAAFAYCSGLTSVTIPNSITSIGGGAFYGCSGLTSVTIPNSITSIETNAFTYCTALTSVTIPNSVKSIGDAAFAGCSGLTSVTISNSVTSIGNYTFADCVGLASVTIPNSVTSIGRSAFTNCSGLTSITCEAVTPPTCDGDYEFSNVDKTIPLYVPAGSVEAYKVANQWEEFSENTLPIQQAAESSVTDIEAEPTATSVVVSWPAVANATIYTIEIKKGSETICTLTFNENGQLMTFSFNAPSRQGYQQIQAATQTATGWKYTIGGLEPNIEYTYTVIAKADESDTEPLYNKTIPFKTKDSATGIDQMSNVKSQMSNKIIKDNQLLILRGDKVYTATGQQIK